MNNSSNDSEVQLRRALASWRQAPTRLLGGVALMIVSGLLASNFLRAESATVPVLQLRVDVAAGQRLDRGDFETRWLPQRLAGDWLSLETLNAGAVASRPLRAGELAMKWDAVGLADSRPLLAIAMPAGELPADLHVGSLVSLWRAGPDGAELLSGMATVRAISEDETTRLRSLTVAVEQASLQSVLQAKAGEGLSVVAVAG